VTFEVLVAVNVKYVGVNVAVFRELFKFIAYTLNEMIVSKCPSRAIM
jgi:hypothetical protein